MLRVVVSLVLIGGVMMSSAGVVVRKGLPATIALQPGASPQDRLAARELATGIADITGIQLPIVETAEVKPNSIVVGFGPASSRYFPEVDSTNVRSEEVVLRTKGDRLLVAGGGSRGTIYAVNRLLHRLGTRWWTPWATTVVKRPELKLENLDVREVPRFEFRSPFWYHAFDRDWARRNNANGHHHRLEPEDGGKVVYEGFVHTFYPLVPPEKHFKDHPEWYSLIDGKRTTDGGQLCTTNPELRDFVVLRVREWLKANPEATIVSVSQNDWQGACQCPNCKALDDAEGTHAASVLALANYVGEKIENDFPNVAVDTLAYQYTRKAPKTLRPRPNVIVRLCSIECSFSRPLTDPSNASFAQDIKDWSRLTDRLYVWNYVTDFPHYMLPFPNWYVVGPNERFFAENGVRGLFEQGAYQSFGASMAPMEAWVQSQLLWDPTQDDRKLIAEFLRGYFGPAAKPVQTYLDLLADAAKDTPMNIWTGPDAPFFTAETVLKADRLWDDAEKLVAKDPDLLWRVKVGRLPIRYVVLSRWKALRAEAEKGKIRWPLPESRKAVADAWLAVAKGPGPKGWEPITHMSESGLTPERWAERFAVDPIPVVLPDRAAVTSLPKDLALPPGAEVVEAQDDLARLFGEGDMAELRADSAASDGIACRMPGTHHEWAFQLSTKSLPSKVLQGKWRVYVVARVDPGADPATRVFTAGVYSDDSSRNLGEVQINAGQASQGYRTYLLATTELTSGCTVWVAPSGDSDKAVWVDRVLFVKE
jgi:hypothetical protein